MPQEQTFFDVMDDTGGDGHGSKSKSRNKKKRSSKSRSHRGGHHRRKSRRERRHRSIDLSKVPTADNENEQPLDDDPLQPERGGQQAKKGKNRPKKKGTKAEPAEIPDEGPCRTTVLVFGCASILTMIIAVSILIINFLDYAEAGILTPTYSNVLRALIGVSILAGIIHLIASIVLLCSGVWSNVLQETRWIQLGYWITCVLALAVFLLTLVFVFRECDRNEEVVRTCLKDYQGIWLPLMFWIILLVIIAIAIELAIWGFFAQLCQFGKGNWSRTLAGLAVIHVLVDLIIAVVLLLCLLDYGAEGNRYTMIPNYPGYGRWFILLAIALSGIHMIGSIVAIVTFCMTPNEAHIPTKGVLTVLNVLTFCCYLALLIAFHYMCADHSGGLHGLCLGEYSAGWVPAMLGMLFLLLTCHCPLVTLFVEGPFHRSKTSSVIMMQRKQTQKV